MTKVKKEWKPEYKYETLEGTFKDYRGVEREFTMVAVSIPTTLQTSVVTEHIPTDEEYEEAWDPDYEEYMYDPADFVDEIDEVKKILSIGIAVRNENDKNIQGLGVRIAYGKAIKLLDHTIYVNDSGMINTTMVRALLQQEAEYFKQDPGHFLKGYNKDKERYAKSLTKVSTPKNQKAITSDIKITKDPIYPEVKAKWTTNYTDM